MATESFVGLHQGTALDTSGLCLLSLDGGGVRGLSTLYVLKNIMWRLNSERRKKGLVQVKPYEIFDLIGGTSTGGLIAIMLGRLEMDIDQCISAYKELMEEVFSNKQHMLPFSLRGKAQPRFLSDKLKEAVEKVIKKQGWSPNDHLNDGAPHGCKVFVCAVAQSVTSAVRFRSYEPTMRPPPVEPTILQAALATSAASTFFESVTVDGQIYIDGGIQVNNPILEVESEAFDLWGPTDRDIKDLVKCIISIGTGKSNTMAIEDGLKDFAAALVAIATETEATARVAVDRWRRQLNAGRFFRFNVDQGLQDVGLQEYKKAGQIAQATHRYLTDQTQVEIVTKCTENLKHKQNKASLEFAKLLREEQNEQIKAAAVKLSQLALKDAAELHQRALRDSNLSQKIRTTTTPTLHTTQVYAALLLNSSRTWKKISSLLLGPIPLLIQSSSLLPKALDIRAKATSKTVDKGEVRELLLHFFCDLPWLFSISRKPFDRCLGYTSMRARCKMIAPQRGKIAKEGQTAELFKELKEIKTNRDDPNGTLLELLEELITLTHCRIHGRKARMECNQIRRLQENGIQTYTSRSSSSHSSESGTMSEEDLYGVSDVSEEAQNSDRVYVSGDDDDRGNIEEPRPEYEPPNDCAVHASTKKLYEGHIPEETGDTELDDFALPPITTSGPIGRYAKKDVLSKFVELGVHMRRAVSLTDSSPVYREIHKPLTRMDLIKGIVYILQDTDRDNLFKIGWTTLTAAKRITQHNICYAKGVKIIYESDDLFLAARRAERLSHIILRHKNMNIHVGDCQRCGGEHGEWINTTEDEVRRTVSITEAFVRLPAYILLDGEMRLSPEGYIFFAGMGQYIT